MKELGLWYRGAKNPLDQFQRARPLDLIAEQHRIPALAEPRVRIQLAGDVVATLLRVIGHPALRGWYAAEYVFLRGFPQQNTVRDYETLGGHRHKLLRLP